MTKKKKTFWEENSCRILTQSDFSLTASFLRNRNGTLRLQGAAVVDLDVG